jgi:protein involved in polysaccharide export with SLBB domain
VGISGFIEIIFSNRESTKGGRTMKSMILGVNDSRSLARRVRHGWIYACLLMTAMAGSAANAQLPPDPATGLVMPPSAPAPASTAAAPVGKRAATEGSYYINPGDELSLHFDYMPELDTVEVVRPDGRVELPLVGSQSAGGRTVAELSASLKTAYAAKLRRAELWISIGKGFGSQQVFVGGEVTRPGVQPLSPSLTALQAIIVAEGFKDTADPGHISILRRGPDNNPQMLKVDVDAVMSGKQPSQDVVLQPFDVVIVQRSAVAGVNQWIDQYIRRNIPFNTGFSYVINRNFAGN